MDGVARDMTDTCGVCHRPLLDPASRAAGIGPVCAAKFNGGHGTAGPEQLTIPTAEEPAPMYHPLRFTTPGLLRFARLIDTERQAQLAKWGEQHHRDGSATGTNIRLCTDLAEGMRQVNADPAEVSWTTIMLEEAYEVGAETDPAKIRAELIQLVAVCAAWISDIEQRPRTCAHCGEPITGEGITWSGPMPKPGEGEYLVPRYHLSRDYPDCRRAADQQED
ncbi:DUF6011 domain-containing protein [Streptomyces sp. NPDC056707]|uniref:DUF6011 domain-containing protein n=1 Tax=Streptomyces sp. NPDC056707 TaxID=3345919 RepID=UPI003696CD87